MRELPFVLHGRSGALVVEYGANEDIEESGFDMFDPSDFDPALALGYPTLQARVERFEGTGYRTATAFIQWLDIERHFDDRVERGRELDATPELIRAGIPYFSLGYPATLYDAPAHNMHGADWMRWDATTWLVTMPARWTDFEIQPLAGFRWGYTESHRGGVEMSRLVQLSARDWSAARTWLTAQAPAFTFATGRESR